MPTEDDVAYRPPNPILAGRIRHGPFERIRRHHHDSAFLAVVLSGRYVEAGDTGRHAVGAGDVIVHRRWESHLNEIDAAGSSVLVLPLPAGWASATRGVVSDPDEIVRIAERDPVGALAAVAATFAEHAEAGLDWPALLAAQLRVDPETALDAWARGMGLHPGSLARGFRQSFGVTPATYRLVQRTRLALDRIEGGSQTLADVAADCGFADQSHMVRAVRALTGETPAPLRRAALGLN